MEDLFIVLDDEQSIRHSIASYLEDEGYSVLSAQSAEGALELVRQNPVTAVVVDIRLPGIDGNTFVIEAKKIRPELKIVIHTGSADYVLPDEVKALGLSQKNVMIKPVRDLSIIFQALKR